MMMLIMMGLKGKKKKQKIEFFIIMSEKPGIQWTYSIPGQRRSQVSLAGGGG